MSLKNQMIYLFWFQLSAFQKSVIMSGPQGPAAPPLPLEGLAGRLASLSKQLGPPIGPSGPQLPPCPPAPSLSTVGQSHPKPVVPNVEYQRSLNSLASSIHSTPKHCWAPTPDISLPEQPEHTCLATSWIFIESPTKQLFFSFPSSFALFGTSPTTATSHCRRG